MIYPKLLFSILLVFDLVRTIEGSCYERTTIKDEDDLMNFEFCTYLGVPLTIPSDFDGKVLLPRLDETHSDITITGDKVTEINLQKLTRTRTLSITDVPNLESLQISYLLKADNLILKNIGGIVDLTFIRSLDKSNHIEISNCRVKNFNGLSVAKIKHLNLTSLSGVTRLRMPFLSSIEGTIEIRNLNDLQVVNLPKLKSIENDAIFSGNPKARISLPVLEKVNSKLVLQDIKEVDVPKLREVNELAFENVATKINSSHNPYFFEKYMSFINNDKLSNDIPPLVEELKEIVSPVEVKHIEEKLIPDHIHIEVSKTNPSSLSTHNHSDSLNKPISNVGALVECDDLGNPILLTDNSKKHVDVKNSGTSSVNQSYNHKPISEERKTSSIGSANFIEKIQQSPSLSEQNTLIGVRPTSIQNSQKELSFNEKNVSLGEFPRSLNDSQHKPSVKEQDFSTPVSPKITQNSQQALSSIKQNGSQVLSSKVNQDAQQNLIFSKQNILPSNSSGTSDNTQFKPSTKKYDNPEVFSPRTIKEYYENIKLAEQELRTIFSYNVSQPNQQNSFLNEICFLDNVSPDDHQHLSPIVSSDNNYESQSQSADVVDISSTSISKDFKTSASSVLVMKPSFIIFAFSFILFY